MSIGAGPSYPYGSGRGGVGVQVYVNCTFRLVTNVVVAWAEWRGCLAKRQRCLLRLMLRLSQCCLGTLGSQDAAAGLTIGIVCAAGGVGSVPNSGLPWFRRRGAGRESVRVEVAYQTGLK